MQRQVIMQCVSTTRNNAHVATTAITLQCRMLHGILQETVVTCMLLFVFSWRRCATARMLFSRIKMITAACVGRVQQVESAGQSR